MHINCLGTFMPILKKVERVEFDPANPAHRKSVQQFMVRNSWADTDIKFLHNPKYGHLIEQVTVETIQWYMNKDKDLT